MNMIWDKKYQRKIHVALLKPFSLEIQCGLCTVPLLQGFIVHNSAL